MTCQAKLFFLLVNVAIALFYVQAGTIAPVQHDEAESESFLDTNSDLSSMATQVSNESDSKPTKGLLLGDSEVTTVGSGILKWCLIGLVVLVPLLLLPILFLFARNGKSGSKVGDTADKPDRKALKPYILLHIRSPMTLLAISPSSDPYLMDRAIWDQKQNQGGPVKQNPQDESPYYYLDPNSTVTQPETGQLYHRSSGLLFNPISGRAFDLKSRLIITTDDSGHSEAGMSNLVYDSDTGKLYERLLALSFNSGPNCPATWSLPTQPNPTIGGPMDKIQRVEPNKLPPILVKQYLKLLSEVQVDEHSSGDKPSTAAEHSPQQDPTIFLDTVSQVVPAYGQQLALDRSSPTRYLDTVSTLVKA